MVVSLGSTKCAYRKESEVTRFLGYGGSTSSYKLAATNPHTGDKPSFASFPTLVVPIMKIYEGLWRIHRGKAGDIRFMMIELARNNTTGWERKA